MKVFLFLILCAVQSIAYAAGWASGGGTAVITTISIEGGLVKVAYTAADTADPDQCGNQGVFILQDDSKNGDRQYSAILSARMSEKPIRIYVSGCYSGWGQTWPKLWSIFI